MSCLLSICKIILIVVVAFLDSPLLLTFECTFFPTEAHKDTVLWTILHQCYWCVMHFRSLEVQSESYMQSIMILMEIVNISSMVYFFLDSSTNCIMKYVAELPKFTILLHLYLLFNTKLATYLSIVMSLVLPYSVSCIFLHELILEGKIGLAELVTF